MSPIYGGECVNSAEHVAGVDTEPPPPPSAPERARCAPPYCRRGVTAPVHAPLHRSTELRAGIVRPTKLGDHSDDYHAILIKYLQLFYRIDSKRHDCIPLRRATFYKLVGFY